MSNRIKDKIKNIFKTEIDGVNIDGNIFHQILDKNREEVKNVEFTLMGCDIKITDCDYYLVNEDHDYNKPSGEDIVIDFLEINFSIYYKGKTLKVKIEYHDYMYLEGLYCKVFIEGRYCSFERLKLIDRVGKLFIEKKEGQKITDIIANKLEENKIDNEPKLYVLIMDKMLLLSEYEESENNVKEEV